MAQNKIKIFYDGFVRDHMLNDFRRLNSRQAAIRKLCDQYVLPNVRVLEIGCGVGILTKYLQKRAKHITSIDITDVGVQVAGLYASAASTEFHVVNILEDTDFIRRKGSFDIVILADVIEHIPATQHAQLFREVENLLNPGGRLILTFPSPEYQTYLKSHQQEQLQVVDETIHLVDLLKVSSLQPLYFAYKNVNENNKYIHMVLQKGIDYQPVNANGYSHKLVNKMKSVAWHIRHLLFLYRLQRTTTL